MPEVGTKKDHVSPWRDWPLAHGQDRKLKAKPLTAGSCNAPGTCVHIGYRD